MYKSENELVYFEIVIQQFCHYSTVIIPGSVLGYRYKLYYKLLHCEIDKKKNNKMNGVK